MKIYRLDVSRRAAGQTIPFDRVYLAHGQARSFVKKLFAYALVLPVSGEFRECLLNTVPYGVPKGDNKEGRKEAWVRFLNSADDWIAVIPILPKRARALMPSYLVNKSWYTRTGTWKERKEKSPLPVLSYLQTPEQNFRPVCIACPRFTEHQAGKCQLGQRICFETLVLGDVLPTPVEEGEADDRDVLTEMLG